MVHYMPAPSKAGHGGWKLRGHSEPGLRELTLEIGNADVYVNMGRRIDMDNGHVLFEAVLTDAQGSRPIYIDREEIVECLRETFLAPSKPEDA